MRNELVEQYVRREARRTADQLIREALSFEDKDYKQWNMTSNNLQLVGGTEPKDLTVQDAQTVRKQAYKLFFENPYARGIIRTMNKFIFGKGVVTTLSETKKNTKTVRTKTEDYLKEWQTLNKWDLSQKETSNRAFRDGELFWYNRKMGDNIPKLEFIEPDNVDSDKVGAELGIEFEPDDPTVVKNYYVKKNVNDAANIAKPFPGRDIVHIKLFVDRNVKRGRSLFEPVFKSLAMHEDWLNNRMILNKMRSAVALVRYVEGTQPQGQAIRRQTQDTSDPRQSNKSKTFKSGTIITAPVGTKYEMLSANLGASDAATDGRNILLRIAVGIGFPEMFLTGDYSNANFASTSVAQSPFVREFEDWQDFFSYYVQEEFKIVCRIGQEIGRVPKDIDLEFNNEWPTLTYEDFVANATALGQLFLNEIISKHTYAAKLDFDYDEEKKLIDEEMAQQAASDLGNFGDDFGVDPEAEEEEEEPKEQNLAASVKHGKGNLLEKTTNVDQHTKHSKKGTAFNVKSHDRKVPMSRNVNDKDSITREEVEAILNKGDIENIRGLGDKGDRKGYSGTYVVSVVKNGQLVDAVFKPQNEENPRNIEQTGGKQTKREGLTAYVADLLGLGDYVPAVTVRSIRDKAFENGGGRGALIEYMDDGLKVGANRELRNSKSFDFKFSVFDKNKDLVGKFSAFDYVIGARDRHAENWKTDGISRFALIDNGQTFRTKNTKSIRSNFLMYAKDKKIKIKDVIGDSWDNAFPAIKKAMSSVGIARAGQNYTKERFDELIAVKNKGGTFADLKIKARN